MEDDEKKKAAAAALAAVIAASGTAVDLTFDNPGEILQQSAVDPAVEHFDSGAGQDDEDGTVIGDPQSAVQIQETGLKGWILQLPLTIRVLFVVPLWAVGHAIVYASGILFAGLSPILDIVGGFLLLFAVILGAFTVTAKAMFPDLPLSKIVNRHTIKGVLLVSVLAFAANQLLGMFWADYARFKNIVTGGTSLAALGAVVIWFARRENRRRKKTAAGQAAAVPPEDDVLTYTSLGQTFTIRKPKE